MNGLKNKTSPWSTALAWLLLVMVDGAMRLWGYPRVHRLLSRFMPRQARNRPLGVVDRTREAVDRAASWYFKRAWCLQRSAVMMLLLRARGISAELVIGARKMPFYAHAWVELDGTVISDGPEVKDQFMVLERYRPPLAAGGGESNRDRGRPEEVGVPS